MANPSYISFTWDVRTQVRISTGEEEVCDVECWRPETETRLEQTGVRSVLT